MIARGRQLQYAFSEKLFADVSQEQRSAFLETMNRIEHNLNEIMEENVQ